MKKTKIVTFILLIIAFTVCGVFAEPLEVLNHSFEYLNGELALIKIVPSPPPDDWLWHDGLQSGIEAPSSDGYVCACVGDRDAIYQLLDYTVGLGDEYTLTFDAYFLYSTGDWNCTFRGALYYEDEDDRVVIDSVESSLSGEGQGYTWYYDYTFTTTIPSGHPAIGKKLGIELSPIEFGSGNNWFGFDNVRLDGELAGSVKCINPLDKSTLVPIDTILEWRAPLSYTPLYYDLYFNTDPNLGTPVLDKQNQTTWDPPGDLEYDTTYYWRVDAYEDVDTVNIGRVWSFTTAPAEPVVLTNPIDVTVEAGQTAEFTVTAYNADSYAWYRSPDMSSSTPTGDIPVGSGDTLTISNVQQSEEGFYYCKLTNIFGDTPTEAVGLWTKRLVGHWNFDNNLVSTVDGWTGEYVDPNGVYEPVYDSNSVAGTSLVLGEPGKIVEIDDSADFYNFYVNGFSAAVWVNSKDLDDMACAVSKQDRSNPDLQKGWLMGYEPSSGFVTVHQTTHDIFGTTDINDDKWHLLVGTFDGSMTTIYIDGTVQRQSGLYGGDKLDKNTINLLIGAENTLGDSQWQGKLDELSIWTYAIDAYEVARLYTDYVDTEICVENPPADLNDDCRVDIGDIAEFGSTWLECNFIPTEYCQ